MEACDVVRLFVSKAVVCELPKHAGNPGYGPLKAVRVLVFARLKGLTNDTRLVEHLKRHKQTTTTLGLKTVPDRTTVGRWWKRYLALLGEVFNKIADMLLLLTPTTLLVVDSTALIDSFDVDARWGKNSKGWFKGFKIHASVNQQGLPLRAAITPANRYDSPILPELVWDLKADFLLADAGYDSKVNRKVAKAIGAKPVIAKNPRKRGKQTSKLGIKYSRLLKAKRYVVEQFNGHFKANLLKECYLKPKGLAKKAAMVYAALISCDVEGLRALLCEEISLKTVSKYWA